MNHFAPAQYGWLKDKGCLVTGGAGFIGSHLVDALLDLGAKVRVLDNLSTGNLRNLERLSELEFSEGSITDVAAVRKALEGIEFVFHLAARPSVPYSIAHPLETGEANVWGSQLLLEEARRAGVRRLVYSASSSAYGDRPGKDARSETLAPIPLSPYAAQKLAVEYLCQAYAKSLGLSTLSLRYFNVFGPRQNPNSQYAAVVPRFLHQALLEQPVVVYGTGEQSRDFTYVTNAVAANLLASNPAVVGDGRVFNTACGSSYTINELIREIEAVLGRQMTVTYQPGRTGDVPYSLADISRAREVLGYEPIVSFREGIRLLTTHFT